jgi:hypothetical protein
MEEEMFELLSCKMGEVPELVCVDVVLEGSKEGKVRERWRGRGGEGRGGGTKDIWGETCGDSQHPKNLGRNIPAFSTM